MKKILIFLMMALLPTMLMAQTAGGQITRKQTTTTTTVKKTQSSAASKTTNSGKRSVTSGKTRSNEVRKEQRGSEYTPPTIQTEPRSNLVGKYHLVIGSFSIGANAQGLCNRMKERGYSPFVYFSKKKNFYRVIVASSYSTSEIIRLRNDLRKEEYDSSWIAYIDDSEDYALTSDGLIPF